MVKRKINKVLISNFKMDNNNITNNNVIVHLVMHDGFVECVQ